jgi:hypothetical protein
MGSRSTYVRRIEQLELAVAGFGHSVVGRRPAARAARDHAPLARLDHAVERILAGAEPAPLCRIALHMHAIAGAVRSVAVHDPVPVPVA